MSAGCLSFLKIRLNGECRFKKNCPYYNTNSYECTHKGSHYCGAYRKHEKEEVKTNAQ